MRRKDGVRRKGAWRRKGGVRRKAGVQLKARACPDGQFASRGRCVGRCPVGSIDWQPSRNANPRCSTALGLRTIIRSIDLGSHNDQLQEFRAMIPQITDRVCESRRAAVKLLRDRLRAMEDRVDELRAAKVQAERALRALTRVRGGGGDRGGGGGGRK